MKTKKLITLMLISLLIFCTIPLMNASAEEPNVFSVEKDGLTLTVKPDKTVIDKGEMITLNISLVNNSGKSFYYGANNTWKMDDRTFEFLSSDGFLSIEEGPTAIAPGQSSSVGNGETYTGAEHFLPAYFLDSAPNRIFYDYGIDMKPKDITDLSQNPYLTLSHEELGIEDTAPGIYNLRLVLRYTLEQPYVHFEPTDAFIIDIPVTIKDPDDPGAILTTASNRNPEFDLSSGEGEIIATTEAPISTKSEGVVSTTERVEVPLISEPTLKADIPQKTLTPPDTTAAKQPVKDSAPGYQNISVPNPNTDADSSLAGIAVAAAALIGLAVVTKKVK